MGGELDHIAGAVSVSGAGDASANGAYRTSGASRNGAPVYWHVEKGGAVAIAREPGTSSKTGKVRHGWVVSEAGRPLYGVRTESCVVPSAGWRALSGAAPVPSVAAFPSLGSLGFSEANRATNSCEAAAERGEWSVVCEACDVGLAALAHYASGRVAGADLDVGAPVLHRATALLSRRGVAAARLGHARSALRDCAAALELAPGLEEVRQTAREAAQSLLAITAEDASELLEAVGRGCILDRCTPLRLRPVEEWIDEALRVAGARELARRKLQDAQACDEPSEAAGGEAEACDPCRSGEVPKGGSQRPSGGPSRSRVDPAYHSGFMAWINFPRAQAIDEAVDTTEWAYDVGHKIAELNWRFIGRRLGVDISDCTRTEAVLRLMEAYDDAGAPRDPRAPPETAVESLIDSAERVAPVKKERVVWDSEARLARPADDVEAELPLRRLRGSAVAGPELPWRADELVGGRKGGHWRQAFIDAAAKDAQEAGVPDLNGIGYPTPAKVR